MPGAIEELLTNLDWKDDKSLNSRLVELSNLKAGDLKLFGQAWSKVEPEMRRRIISRLVELADGNIELNYDDIFVGCLKDADPEVRIIAIEGLWESEDASLVSPLISLLQQDKSGEVQASAAMALGKFAMMAELDKLRTEHMLRIEQALLGAFGNMKLCLEVRCLALEAVAPLHLPRVKKAITEAYQSKEPKLKLSSVYAMGMNCDPCWMPMLLKELASPSGEIRHRAIRACGEVGEEEAIPHLIKLINGTDDELAVAAVEALGKIGGDTAKEYLEELLDHMEESVSQAAEKALKEMEAEEDLFRFSS